MVRRRKGAYRLSMWKRLLSVFDWLARLDFVRNITASIFGASAPAKIAYGIFAMVGAAATAWQSFIHNISPALWVPLSLLAAILVLIASNQVLMLVARLKGRD